MLKNCRRNNRGMSDVGVVLVLIILLLGMVGIIYWRWQVKHPKAPLVSSTQPITLPSLPKVTDILPQSIPGTITEKNTGSEDVPVGTIDRDLVYGGEPKGQPVQVLKNIAYEVGYSNERKNPLWVGYRIFRVADAPALPRPDKFSMDSRTQAQVTSHDYTDSGFDRGHMAPNHTIAKHFGKKAQTETFLMSNITPQRHVLNAGVWENLERMEDADYAQEFEEIWIIDGPIFGEKPAEIGRGVQVPKAFYKIIVREENHQPKILAFIMPQPAGMKDSSVGEKVEPGNFRSSVRTIEQQTGLNFFWQLPAKIQEREETVVGPMWATR